METENQPENEPRQILTTPIQFVNSIFTLVYSRRDRILHLGNPWHAYVRKNLREASVKVRIPSEHLDEDIQLSVQHRCPPNVTPM